MLAPLTEEQFNWVNQTMAGLSMEQCVGHLLCPEDRRYSPSDWEDLFRKVPLGSIFVGNLTAGELRSRLLNIQRWSKVPVLVASDLEHGAGGCVEDGTEFPWQMAAGAANHPELMRRMGVATAREGRYAGIHWTFSPVVDLNVNFRNVVTNIRALTDDPERAIRLLPPLIEGLQANGMAATAKHFPGDGMDERDQHLCTSVNSLPMDAWRATYGRVWKAVFDAGIMSVMAGHISLPAYEGFTHDPEEALPATLSRKLQVDLLRGELGFQGVLVSDAAPMIGLTSRIPDDEVVVGNIEAGSDIHLFAHPIEDFERLMTAVRSGRIQEERVRESVRRVLEMKARLNLHIDPFSPRPTEADKATFGRDAQTMADRSATVLRTDSRPPLKLRPGAKVLTVTLRFENDARKPLDLSVFDEELRRRGLWVDHLLNPDHNELRHKVGQYDAAFINVYIVPHMLMGVASMIGQLGFAFWRAFFANHDNVAFTSFGTPYLLYNLPHIPNLLAVYGGSPVSQVTAARVWLGEIEATADCPVTLPRIQINTLSQ